MELKVGSFDSKLGKTVFQSHLYGIESWMTNLCPCFLFGFQSHLYGIESSLVYELRSLTLVSIAPLWN